MQSRFCLGVVAARQSRDYLTLDQMDAAVEHLMEPYLRVRNLSVITSGCDSGIPQTLKTFCTTSGVNFLEVRVVMDGVLERADLNRVWMARNGSILELANQLLLVTTPRRSSSLIEDMVERTKRLHKPYSLYIPRDGALTEIEFEKERR